MNNYRIYVEKRKGFEVEAKSLLGDFKENLQLTNLQNVRLLNVYDLFNITSEDLVKAKESIFAEPATDDVYDEFDLTGKKYFAVEYLPGQFDQRADSAVQCLGLITESADAAVKSGKILILEGDISTTDVERIKEYFINPIESREKDLASPLALDKVDAPEEVKFYDGFVNLDNEGVYAFRKELGLAMSDKDILFVQNYFKNEEKRDPSETEIRVLDTYWSDHCRHTTFETEIKKVTFPEGKFAEVLQKTYEEYLESREYVHGGKKPMSLMDMATISGKEERKKGNLPDLEVSDEINACSIRVKVDVEGVLEDWLLMFKNETHNHPTEIEPFGGASTCIGGAIRDPLSGRSYVYQAMRVTGAANINEKLEGTMEGKLPQSRISKGAAHGYSSYGNQIGLATTFVKEIFHEGYKAKRMEVGAVVGAVKEDWVRREKPATGDIIILLGGKTGRDGCGGATGSSKEHTTESITTCSAEVQKGNAPEERKIQKLFRNDKVTKLIKKCNDFGAGGVSVAIGELADGLQIDLDKVPVKYLGLNGTELSISESQERMAVVVEPKDVEEFCRYAALENLESSIAAIVTEEARLVMNWKGKTIVNLSRAFLDTNGVRNEIEVAVEDVKADFPQPKFEGNTTKEKLINLLKSDNVASQQGMVEMFDSHVGASTVLMPYGGKYQLTEEEASVQKVPVLGKESNTASIMTFGYNPFISEWSPFHGAAYAVVESISKVVAVGGKWQGIRFSFQEYFERLGNNTETWGKPFSALLGTLFVQKGFGLPAIGGKDSMSGTFNNIHVPPTLISFAVNTESADNIISAEFKNSGNYVYVVKHNPTADMMPNIDELKANYDFVYENVSNAKIVSASTVKNGGIAECLAKMSFGNKVGVEVVKEIDLFSYDYGTLVVESVEELNFANAILIGKTTKAKEINILGETVSIDEAIKAYLGTFDHLYPRIVDETEKDLEIRDYKGTVNIITKGLYIKPNVFVPAFPGTNSEYDSVNAFIKAGANAKTLTFRNLNHNYIEESIEAFVKEINNSQILMFPGGFSAGDEPDGSGKFVANVLLNERMKAAVEGLLNRGGLILGICNGFQALIKSGLLPNGIIGDVTKDSPTLAKNNINRHITKIVHTRITSNNSPWLMNTPVGAIHEIAVSHGEGKFVASPELIEELFKNGQVATQYVNLDGVPTMNGEFNPNGSFAAIEGITSADGRILGKMGHSERKGTNVFKNIIGEKDQLIFENGVKYFK